MKPAFHPSVFMHGLRRRAHPHRQRGVTLIEGLIAVVVFSLGVAAIGSVQARLRIGSDIARQRSEAVRLGQEDLEGLRSFASVAASGSSRSFADVASAGATIDSGSGYATNTSYHLVRTVTTDPATGGKTTAVTVAWADRAGADQRIVLTSVVGAADPAFAAALSRVPSASTVKGAGGRSVWIPLAARDLGDGRSALKPVTGGTTAYVFDNATGLVISRCVAVAAAVQTSGLSAAALAGCNASTGYLLSGVVRFSLSAPPDPAHANDAPSGLAIALTLSGGQYATPPFCASEALKTVTYASAGSMHRDAVPLAATPASIGVTGWNASGERFVAWQCVVYPLAGGKWSGRADVVPAGWSIGTTANDFRICRYAADSDGSGAVDTNIEHPASYSNVRGPLANQNFLVIVGTQGCPVASAVQVAGNASDVEVDLSTVQHQP